MKILALNLIAWGPFAGWSVDLSDGAGGLHLIYGPNEAGKSSALRGLKALLFGVGERTTDEFLHGYKKLLVGGTLLRSDGARLEIRRKKGRTRTLLAPDDSVIDERTLQEFLGGVTPESFSRMFGLDHEELRAGGREIVSGKGDVGQSLFVAALGGRSIQQILDSLEAEAGQLFLPSPVARRKVNVQLDEYLQAMKEAREASLPARDWEEHTQGLNEAEQRKGALLEQIRSAKAELGRLERIRGALTSLGRRKELQEQRAGMGEVLILPVDFPARRKATMKALSDAGEARARAQRKLESLKSQIDSLTVPVPLLDEAEAVTEMHQAMGSHRKAMQDLPKLNGEAGQLEADVAAILNEIRPGAAIEEIDAFKTGLAKRKTIRELGARLDVLTQSLQASRKSVRTFQDRIGQARNSLAGAEAPRDPGTLRDLLKRVRKLGDLEAAIEKKRSQFDAETGQAGVEMKKLPLWTGILDQLEALPLPDEESIARFESGFAGIEQQESALESRRDEARTKASESAGKLKTLELTTAVPTEQDLEEARLRREAGWRLVRAAWLDAGAPQEEAEAFCAGEPLDKAYEGSVRLADETADRLRREADRVAQHAALLVERARIETEIRELEEKRGGLAGARLGLQNEWAGLWREAGIDPLPPREMRSWAQRQRALAQRAGGIRACREEIDRAQAQIAALSGEITAELGRIGFAAPEPALTLNALIDHAQSVVDRIEKANDERRRLEATISDAEEELSDAQRQAGEADEDLQKWQSQWIEAVKEIGLSGSDLPAVANQLLDRVQDLTRKTEELARLRRRIESMQRDAAAFAARVQQLAGRTAPDLLNLPPEAIASQLHARLARGREDDAARKQLMQQQKEQEQSLVEAEEAIREAERGLHEMCALAGCGIDRLEGAEKLSAEAVAIDAELKSISKELLAFAGGGTVEDLVREAQGIDPDSLPGRIDELGQQISAHEDEMSRLDQTIGSERAELMRMDGSSRAADAAEKAQSSLAQIRDGVERYVRLRLAGAILRREMEAYRVKNQGPVLKRASEIFAELTLGSFAGLRTNLDEDGRPVLAGTRPSGEEVTVDGMSDGTCDQLYLALRLASLEKHLESREPMPFVIDDILVNFDDGRAKATFEVLAECAKKTQIIFFTHHQHLVGIAKKSVSKDILCVHPMQE